MQYITHHMNVTMEIVNTNSTNLDSTQSTIFYSYITICIGEFDKTALKYIYFWLKKKNPGKLVINPYDKTQKDLKRQSHSTSFKDMVWYFYYVRINYVSSLWTRGWPETNTLFIYLFPSLAIDLPIAGGTAIEPGSFLIVLHPGQTKNTHTWNVRQDFLWSAIMEFVNCRHVGSENETQRNPFSPAKLSFITRLAEFSWRHCNPFT